MMYQQAIIPIKSRRTPSVTTHNNGFTLLEILVALAILAIALAAIVTEVNLDIRNATYLREKTLAHWVAMNKVTEWHVSGDWPSPGSSHGDMLMAEHEWAWQLTVSTTEDENVRRMDVEVRADENEEKPTTTVIAYIGRPME